MRTTDPAVIEHRLLDLAYTTDRTLTAPLLAFYVPCSIDDAERMLERLTLASRLRMEVDDDGGIYYELPHRQQLAPTERALARRFHVEAIDLREPPHPAAAALLSMVVPGAGQLYAGRPISAVAWFVLVAMGYMLLIVPGLLLHILCVAAAAGSAHHWRPSMA